MKSLIKINIIILCLLAGFHLSSCSKEEMHVSEQERSLSLETANGKKLASSIAVLKNELSIYVSRQFDGNDIEFSITKIEHSLVNGKHFISLIYYRTECGIEGNIIYSDISFDDDIYIPVRLKNGNESSDDEFRRYQCTNEPGTVCYFGEIRGCFIIYVEHADRPQCSCYDKCVLNKL